MIPHDGLAPCCKHRVDKHASFATGGGCKEKDCSCRNSRTTAAQQYRYNPKHGRDQA
jgi:hypothetical protein